MVAAAVVGSAVVGGVVSSQASKSAADSQSKAAKNASDATMQQFYTINDQQAPYRQSGYGALSALNNYLGIAQNAPEQSEANFDSTAYLAAHLEVADKSKWAGTPWQHYQMYGKGYGYQFTGNNDYNNQLKTSQNGSNNPGFGQFTHQFDANDLNANLAPNYDFMLKQGQGQVGNTLNSTAGLLSGNAQQGLNTFTQNYAKNAYQDAFNNYTTNQTNIYNRLASLAGLGQTSLGQSAAAGTAATNASNNYLTSGAAANAAGTVGQANALSNAAGTIGNYYALSSMAA